MNSTLNGKRWKSTFGKGAISSGIILTGVIVWLAAPQVDLAETSSREQPRIAKPKASGDQAGASTATLDDALAIAEEARRTLRDIRDYTAHFAKTEMVSDEVVVQSMEVKVRHQPFSVYLHCVEGQAQGREVIFVHGQNDDKLLGHESGLKGLAGTLSLRPDDSLAMADCRYPITEMGIAKVLEKAVGVWEGQKQKDPDNADVQIVDGHVGSTPCKVVQLTQRSRKPGMEYRLDRVYFDKKSHLPIKAERYGWPVKGEKSPLLEQYTYTNIKTNVGLTDSDFSTENPKYRFGGSKLSLLRRR